MSFGLTVKQFLYSKGMKKYGQDLLKSKSRGSPEWLAFGQGLLKDNDFPTRDAFLKQATTKGFFQKNPNRAKVQEVLLEYLKKGLSDEKRVILGFFIQNVELFSKDDDKFTSAVYAAQRERDTLVANTAEQVLAKLGFEVKVQKPVR